MAVHTHKVRKSGRTTNEKLPDINGIMVTYAGSVDLEIEVTQRQSSEPTLGQFGEQITVGGRSGILVEASAEILPQYKLDGAIPWETVYRLSPTGTTV